MTAKMAALVVGIVLILFGLLGFFSDPVLGMFRTGLANNVIHVAAGVFLLLGAYSTLGSGTALKVVGVVYAVIAILGFFLVSNDLLLGFIAVNQPGQWLHVGLAAIILLAGFLLPDDDIGMPM